MRGIKLQNSLIVLVDDEDYDILVQHHWVALKKHRNYGYYAIRTIPRADITYFHVISITYKSSIHFHKLKNMLCKNVRY